MARFRYLGEPERPGLVKVQGPCTLIRVPCKDGSKLEIMPPGRKQSFAGGSDIGVDVTDERALRSLRADTRYAEIP